MKNRNIDSRRVLKFLGPETSLLLGLAVVLGLIDFIIEATFIFVLQGLLISFGISDKSKVILPAWYPTSVYASLIIFIIFGVLRSLNTVFKLYASNYSNQVFVQTNRARMFLYGLMNRSSVNSTQIMSLFSDTAVRGGWGIYFACQIIIKLIAAVCLFFVGLWFAPIEMLVGLILLFIFVFPLRSLNQKVLAVGRGLVSEWERINTNFSQGLKNNFFLRAHGLLDTLLLSGRKSIDQYQKHHKVSFFISALKVGAPNFIGTFIITIIIFISLFYVKTSGAILLSFLYVFIRFIQAAGEVAVAQNDFRVNYPAIKALWDFFSIFEKASVNYPKADVEALKQRRAINKIELNVGSFSYGAAEILTGVHFVLRKGERLHLKGQSGSGKSTLISLLLGLQKIKTGTYTINGEATVFDQAFYNSVSYVGPEPFLLATTIRENLLFGHPDSAVVSDLNLVEALSACSLWEELSAKGMGLDSELQEIAELSTGQKQRLALARALLKRPELLILDEATANIDRVTEKKIFKGIENYLASTIYIFVGHKDLEYENFGKELSL